jgi:hypothetical protein
MSILRERIKLAEKMRKKPEYPFQLKPKSYGPPQAIWMDRVYSNNRYIVMIDDHRKTTHGEAICALIQAVDGLPIKNHWSELQRIKNEIFGPETLAIEYYPAESKLTNDHNIYWLWIFPDGIIPTKI